MSSQNTSLPVVRGTLSGLGAYLLGYLATYLVAAPKLEDLVAVRAFEFFTGENPVWKLVGWLFYNEHFVVTVVPRLAGSESVNFLTDTDDGSAVILFFVPVVLLVAAGVLASLGRSGSAPSRSAVAGASVAGGYVLPAVAGAQLFRITVGDATAAPDFVTAILVAGLLYPLVFGTVGGLLVWFYRSRQTSSPQ